MKPPCPPVLFLVFNRPDTTRRVFDCIREAKPARLFVAADGSRNDRPGEAELCRAARAVADEVDWPCEVSTLYRERNQGCEQAVGSAISWFFERVEEGIILEDDTLPDPAFFPFCGELLARYRQEERVMTISGDNFQSPEFDPGASYYFSVYAHVWGWATWRRAWFHYDPSMPRWPELRDTDWLTKWLDDTETAAYWRQVFDLVHRGEINTWACRWLLSVWLRGGLNILPAKNLVSNIGFDRRATHTTSLTSAQANLPAFSLDFPLRHPSAMARNCAADRHTARHHYGIQPAKSAGLLQRLKAGVSKAVAKTRAP